MKSLPYFINRQPLILCIEPNNIIKRIRFDHIFAMNCDCDKVSPSVTAFEMKVAAFASYQDIAVSFEKPYHLFTIDDRAFDW